MAHVPAEHPAPLTAEEWAAKQAEVEHIRSKNVPAPDAETKEREAGFVARAAESEAAARGITPTEENV